MIPYILNVALLISVCLVFYKVLLQRETFYRLNRWFLVLCLALSFALPLIPIPQQWALRETSAPTAKKNFVTKNTANIEQYIASAKLTAVKKETIANSKENYKAKAAPVVAERPMQTLPIEQLSLLPEVIKWLIILYWIGVGAFGLNLFLQVVVLLYQAYTNPVIKDGRFRIVELSGDKAPCSFGNSIFINPEKYDWETYSQILLHEKIHIEQRHSFDILMAEMVLVVQWFNPFAWLYRTEVESNLEFLTDYSVLEHQEIERTSYQMSLLKVSAPYLSMGITTNYNQSLLKRRIIMMNAKRSNIHTMWKYFFLIALLGVLACALNDPAAYAQSVKKQIVKSKIYSKNSRQFFKNTETDGSWFATIKGGQVRMEFKSDQDDQNWSSNSDFALSEFSALPKDAKGDFTLTREAGTVLFNGKFDSNQGYGHYKFKVNVDFSKYLTDYGVKNMKEGDEFAFFMLNVKKEYIIMLAGNGYKHLTKDEIISMTALKVDAGYIAYWKGIGYNLTSNELVSGKALGLNSAYVDEIRKAGYEHITFDQLVSFKATGVTAKYIAGLHGADKTTDKEGKQTKKTSADDVISVKALNVDDAYVSGIQKEGYSNVSLNDLTSMKAVGVTPEYISELKSAGYSNIPISDLISLKSLGVDPVYVKGFTDLGYKNIPVDDLSSMKASGVTPVFVQGFQAEGYKNIRLADLVSIRALGITPEFAKSFDAAGFKNIQVSDLSSIKALGITAEYVQSFREIGYKNISIENVSSLKALGVTAKFINGFKKIGYPNIPLDEVSSLKATGVTPEYVNQMRERGFKSDDLSKYIELKTAFK